MAVMGTLSVALGMDRGVQSSCALLVIPFVSTQDSGLILLTGGDIEALRWEVIGSGHRKWPELEFKGSPV